MSLGELSPTQAQTRSVPGMNFASLSTCKTRK